MPRRAPAHVVSSDRPPRTDVRNLDIGRARVAKAHVPVLDLPAASAVLMPDAVEAWRRDPARQAVAEAVARALRMVWPTFKEAAAEIGVDEAELGKWASAERRPHFDRLFAVRCLQQPLLVSLSSLVHDAEAITEIRLRAGGDR